MEPISALGLASNIIQLIHFGYAVLSETHKAYDSASGVSDEFADMETIAKHIQDLHSSSISFSTNQGGQDTNRTKIYASCNEVARELLTAIEQIRVNKGPRRRWRSFRQALLSVWRKEKIAALQKRLSSLRSEVSADILMTIK